MKEQIEKQTIEEMAKVIEGTEKVAMDSVGVLPSPTMYAKDLYWHGYRKQEWISVDERFPEESGEYLVFGRTFGNKKPQIWICECISIGSVMGWCNSATNPIVEAWMPLPEPPKMKGGAE